MKNNLFLCLGVTVLLLSNCPSGFAQDIALANDNQERGALLMAKGWLRVVDQGQGEQSWKDASSYFKSRWKKERWISQVSQARKILGKLKSRALKNKLIAELPPGAPDGEYLDITYATATVHKSAVTETVTVMKEKDGQWRVAGYIIR